MAIFLPADDEAEDNDDLEAKEKEDLHDDKSKVVHSKKQAPRLRVGPFRCRVAEAADALRLSKRQLTYRINNGELATVRDGSGRYVLISDLIKYAKMDRPIPPPKRVRGKGGV
jgi:hypothetical protein